MLEFALFLIIFSPNASLAQNEVEVRRDLDRFKGLGVPLNDWAQGQIQFWYKIYTEYTTSQTVIHDSVNLKRIYQIVPDQPKEVLKIKNEIHQQLISIYRKNAKRHAIDVDQLSEDEYRYYLIHDAIEDPKAYQFASDPSRIRSQIGQKDRLENAFSISKRYLNRMEEMFEEEGVPKELTRLPFVESGFLHEAKSSSGAIGIWQFMPKTAQKDLRVDLAIDERYDPLKATRAAARFLKQNYKTLKNWSLAVMAYHHGPGLVQRAVTRLKTRDPVQIISLFKHPSFQFASRNYLFEFLAMLDVDARHVSFFKHEEGGGLPPYITVSFPKKMLMKDIFSRYRSEDSLTRILNPHFRDPIWRNQTAIPAHYPVRLSGISLEEFRKIGYPQGN
jgi:membrane-bound lytic murein transglycosylase D